MKDVEQIDAKGNVVLAKDTELSVNEIRDILSKQLNVLNDRNPFEVEINGKRFLLCVKNVSYLGHPHPIHKKRIQIPGSWQPVLRKENAVLLGVYQYDGQTFFVRFDTSRYRKNRLNNSSAHVHTIDLLNAWRYGEFSKVDKRGNHILTFKEDRLKDVLATLAKGEDVLLAPEVGVVDAFSRSIPSFWLGKNCYREMLNAHFPDALQPEWAGFYLEYRFSEFLKGNKKYAAVCTYVKNKKKGKDLDFDLKFPEFLGDLKTHDVGSNAILGNDLKAVNEALKRHKRMWYVIVNHRSVKDKSKAYVVTRFWNGLLNKRDGDTKDPLSYGNKMKYSATLSEVLIAEINQSNRKYLKTFSQGKNSNGLPRAIKVKIGARDQDNFVIYRKTI